MSENRDFLVIFNRHFQVACFVRTITKNPSEFILLSQENEMQQILTLKKQEAEKYSKFLREL